MTIKDSSLRQGMRVAQAREQGSSGNLRVVEASIENQNKVAEAINNLNTEYVPFQKLSEIPKVRTFSGTVTDILNAGAEGAFTTASGVFDAFYLNVLNPTNPNQDKLNRLRSVTPYFENGEWVQVGTPEHYRGRLEQETKDVMDNFAHINSLQPTRDKLGLNAVEQAIKDNYSDFYKQTE